MSISGCVGAAGEPSLLRHCGNSLRQRLANFTITPIGQHIGPAPPHDVQMIAENRVSETSSYSFCNFDRRSAAKSATDKCGFGFPLRFLMSLPFPILLSSDHFPAGLLYVLRLNRISFPRIKRFCETVGFWRRRLNVWPELSTNRMRSPLRRISNEHRRRRKAANIGF